MMSKVQQSGPTLPSQIGAVGSYPGYLFRKILPLCENMVCGRRDEQATQSIRVFRRDKD